MSKREKHLNLRQPKLNWHDNTEITDINVEWLYEAHSLILLAIVLSVIFYCCFGGISSSIQHGIYLNIFLFLAVGCLVFPAGPFQHPHPIFWRLIFGVSLLYAFLLLLLLSQQPDDARELLSKLFDDDTLGKPLISRSYAVDCRFEYDVIISVLDRFIFAHFLGWTVKAFIVRDRTILWILSVLWELIELATKYFIPNFAECWWDQWILDVALCNALGIEAGLYIAHKWFADDHPERHRDWMGPKYGWKSVCGKFKRLLTQFTPKSLTPMEWLPFQSFYRYYQIHLFVFCCVIIDLNAFLLKLYLYIPTEHPLNLWRLVLMFFFFFVSAKQYYLWITNKECKKMGSQAWMCFVILMLELALSIKCAPNDFPAVPFTNKICWAIFIVIYLVFTYVMFRDLRHVHID